MTSPRDFGFSSIIRSDTHSSMAAISSPFEASYNITQAAQDDFHKALFIVSLDSSLCTLCLFCSVGDMMLFGSGWAGWALCKSSTGLLDDQ